jgi:hypothetical protein
VRIVGRRGGAWSPFVTAWTLHRAPYAVRQHRDGFVAVARLRS